MPRSTTHASGSTPQLKAVVHQTGLTRSPFVPTTRNGGTRPRPLVRPAPRPLPERGPHRARGRHQPVRIRDKRPCQLRRPIRPGPGMHRPGGTTITGASAVGHGRTRARRSHMCIVRKKMMRYHIIGSSGLLSLPARSCTGPGRETRREGPAGMCGGKLAHSIHCRAPL